MAKGKKDPNAPKKPLTAYFLFSAEKRQEVKDEDPERKIGDIAKILGEKWGAMSDAEKKPYVDKAEKAKEQYKKDFAVYQENKPDDEDEDDEDEQPKKKKRAKDPNAPKKPLTAYFNFLAERRAIVKEEQPNLSNKELVTELGRQWSELDDAAKKPFLDKYTAEKAEYDKLVKEYNA